MECASDESRQQVLPVTANVLIRKYEARDQDAVRRICCETGFLGQPIDPLFEDRELFADYLTRYYTDKEPESSFVLEKNGEIRGYLLGSRRTLYHQTFGFYHNLWLFARDSIVTLLDLTMKLRGNLFVGFYSML